MNRILAAAVSAVVLLAGGSAAAQTAGLAKSAFDKKTMADYVRHLILYPPHVQLSVGDPTASDLPGFKLVTVTATAGQASEDRTFYVSSDGQKLIQATVYDIGRHPFEKDMAKLKTDMQPSMGTPGAPVVIVMFSDYQCSYCKKEAEVVRKELLKAFPTEVRLYFRDFPIDQIHPWARAAAVAGRCVFRQDALAYWDYHDWIFAKQAEVTAENLSAKLEEFVKTKELDQAQLNACRESQSAKDEVEASVKMGKDLGVNSTPTLFINGRKLGGAVPWTNLKSIIQAEAGYQAVANNAGEKCCQAKVPSPLEAPANPVLPALVAPPQKKSN